MFHVGQWIEEQYLVLEKRRSRCWVEYIVQDRISQNIFTIKRLSDVVLSDASAAVRFAGKAKIWVNLGECDEIAIAYMVKEYDAIPHVFLEYIDGPSLAALFHAHPGKALPLEQTTVMMRQLVSGMRFLHNASLLEGTGSIVHGGINPRSILTKDGNIKISDIGMAAALRQCYNRPAVDLLLEEVPYLAPEQLRDPARADEPSDIYAFGAVLYEAATGAAPTVAKKSEDPLRDFLALNLISPRLRNRSCPPWLEETILKCMAREPENRFQSFNQIDSFLDDVLRNEKVARKKLAIGGGDAEGASRVSKVRGAAKKEARRLNHYYLGVEHLMLGLLSEEENLVVTCFGDKFTTSQIRGELLAHLPKGEGPWYWDGIIKTPRYARVMSLARKITRHYGHERMLPQHILLAILEEGRNAPARALRELRADLKYAAEYLREELRQRTPALVAADSDTPLGRFTRRVICQRYLPDAIPFIGNSEELSRAIHALVESRKGALVVGDAGVGKTVFVQELECHLHDSLSESGRSYGGLFELQKANLFCESEDDEQKEVNFTDVITALAATDAVLLIEGLETLLGMGAGSHSAFFAEALDNAVASNGLLLVATTTSQGLQSCELEAKRVISHFEMIRLAEPSREMMGEILAGAKCILEAEHSVEIDDDALAAALEAPCRSSESLPGRALELLECACLSQRLLAARGSRICINATDIENLSKTHLTRRP